jgi:dTDP-4-amino-4,6-dideoxy-D-galactose acyltransferase
MPNAVSSAVSVAKVEPLPWDSAHFGFPVARIVAGAEAGDRLAEAVETARRDGFVLIYLVIDPEVRVPASLLDRFSGRKVDDKLVFASDLDSGPELSGSDSLVTVFAPQEAPSSRLVELAVEAGAHSRFGVDPRIPGDAFRRLYEIWITRSCLGETADAVLVTSRADASDEPLGLATLSVDGETASIGLLAVHRDARRRGVGSHTIHRAHDWLRRRGVRRATVATQLDNAPACRLYQACGYQLAEHKTIYHFWPLDAAGA